jgi:glutamyl-tRNA synthetase
MAEAVRFYFVPDDKLEYDEKAVKKHLKQEDRERLAALSEAVSASDDWSETALHDVVQAFCEARGIKLKHVAQPCRVALTGSASGPGLFEMMAVLGRTSTLARLGHVASGS